MKKKIILFIGCALLLQYVPAWGKNNTFNVIGAHIFTNPFDSLEQKVSSRRNIRAQERIRPEERVIRQRKQKVGRLKLWTRMPRRIEATGKRVFIFDPRKRKWAAYDESGKRIRSGKASGGSNFCPDMNRSCHTPVGTFRVYRKGGEACASSQFPLGRGGAPMPYCMFFHEGYAIHGSPDVPNFNASHGCIRVMPNLAKWLSEDFIQNGTTIIIRPY